MAEPVEQRFGALERAPYPIQWLSDNGPPYTAAETRVFAETPRARTVYDTLVRQLPAWLEDYNEWAPHKGSGGLT